MPTADLGQIASCECLLLGTRTQVPRCLQGVGRALVKLALRSSEPDNLGQVTYIVCRLVAESFAITHSPLVIRTRQHSIRTSTSHYPENQIDDIKYDYRTHTDYATCSYLCYCLPGGELLSWARSYVLPLPTRKPVKIPLTYTHVKRTTR